MKQSNSLRVAIASDHAGFILKGELCTYGLHIGHIILDLGTHSLGSVDYPDIAQGMHNTLLANDAEYGILICGTGIGMSIAANRYQNIRAALCHHVEYARLARLHNNANVLVLGARFIAAQEAITILNAFLETEFEGGRHANRVEKLC